MSEKPQTKGELETAYAHRSGAEGGKSFFRAFRGPGRNKTRTHRGAWFEFLDETPVFSKALTIDPSQVEDAWTRLNTNTWAAEFNSLPLLMHVALVNTLRRSKFFGKKD